jgi:hypothetical protein
MSKQRRLFLFTIIFFCITIAMIVYRYEYLLKQQNKERQQWSAVLGGYPSAKQYTAAEIIDLIKKSKEYMGDSITIFDNGEMTSSNGKFQGTIAAVLNSKDNMKIVMDNVKTNKLPMQYNVYLLAASYYRQQYSDEFK